MKFRYEAFVPFNREIYWNSIRESVEFLSFQCAELNLKSISVLEKSQISPGKIMTRVKTVPNVACGGIIKGLLGGKTLEFVDVHCENIGDFSSEFETIPPVLKEKISIVGRLYVEEISEDSCRQILQGEAVVNVFGGGIVAKMITDGLQKTYKQLPEMLRKFKIMYDERLRKNQITIDQGNMPKLVAVKESSESTVVHVMTPKIKSKKAHRRNHSDVVPISFDPEFIEPQKKDKDVIVTAAAPPVEEYGDDDSFHSLDDDDLAHGHNPLWLGNAIESAFASGPLVPPTRDQILTIPAPGTLVTVNHEDPAGSRSRIFKAPKMPAFLSPTRTKHARQSSKSKGDFTQLDSSPEQDPHDLMDTKHENFYALKVEHRRTDSRLIVTMNPPALKLSPGASIVASTSSSTLAAVASLEPESPALVSNGDDAVTTEIFLTPRGVHQQQQAANTITTTTSKSTTSRNPAVPIHTFSEPPISASRKSMQSSKSFLPHHHHQDDKENAINHSRSVPAHTSSSSSSSASASNAIKKKPSWLRSIMFCAKPKASKLPSN